MTGSSTPLRAANLPLAPLWYFTSPEPCTLSGSRFPSNSAKISPVGLAHDVGEHVQPAAVGHPEHRLFDAALAASSRIGVEQRDRRLGSLEAEPLLADIAGVQEALEGLGRVQPLEDVVLLLGRTACPGTPSTWRWIQRFCSGSWMCMYSMPMVRQ